MGFNSGFKGLSEIFTNIHKTIMEQTFLQKPMVSQLFKRAPLFYEDGRFISGFTTAHLWLLFSATSSRAFP